MDNDNLARLMEAIGPRADWLTDGERRTLEWLASWETATVDNLVSILHKQTQDPDTHAIIL